MKRAPLIILLFGLLAALCGCGGNSPAATKEPVATVGEPSAAPQDDTAKTPTETETVPPKAEPAEDITALCKLDMHSDSLKQEVRIRSFVDGDTTHFLVPKSLLPEGIMKARYLAINTPESTGKVEEYGKTAALFTREKLESAEAILVESDNHQWNLDTNGERHLVWVWYKPRGGEEYRNLNLEILEHGLALANSSANNRYGAYCMQALEKARSQKLGLYSGEKDPNFYYGDAIELTLREIRLHPENYEGSKVAFEAVVTRNMSGTVYVEEYDPELELYFGMAVYLGHDLSGEGLSIMSVGNRVRIVGTLQYYETGESWQVSGLSYRAMRPQDPGNIQKLGEGYEPAYFPTDPKTFAQGSVDVPEEKAYDYAWLTLDSTLSMEDLRIQEAAFSASQTAEALMLVCEKEGVSLSLRLAKKDWGTAFEELKSAELTGKTIRIKGLVSVYQGRYQIRILSPRDMEFVSP